MSLTKPIRVILVDDEPKALGMLANSINEYCPNLNIAGQYTSSLTAKEEILKLNPDIVFLDIMMPDLDGFGLLESFEKPSFEVIFATAYDEYAINAINKCAIGYLLKPIDEKDLINAVHNASISIEKKQASLKNEYFIQNLNTENSSSSKIAIPTSEGLFFFSEKEIVRVEGYDGYSKIFPVGQKMITSSYSIGHFSKIMEGNSSFSMPHKSHLINLEHIKKVTPENMVILSDDSAVPISKRKKKEFLDLIRS